MVASIANGSPPSMPLTSNSGFFEKVKASMLLFATLQVPASADSQAHILRGELAVLREFAIVKGKVGANQQVAVPELHLLWLYGWCLSANDRDLVKGWRSKAIAEAAKSAKGGCGAALLATAASSSSSSLAGLGMSK
eukprot:11896245-Alexandrium_andersonii.AAC.1